MSGLDSQRSRGLAGGRRGGEARLDVDANDMNQEAARRSWDAAEALCAVADAASSPES